MAGRSTWKGYLRLSLVACAVKVYTATSSEGGVSFNMLHKDTKNRVNMKYHDPELGEVPRSDLVKGYQFDKDRYVVVDADEIEAIEIESSKTIDIDGFVDASDVDPIYLDSPYYLGPDGKVAEETYAVIMEAMRKAKKAGVARIVMNGRERLVLIAPRDGALLMTTLRVGNEVKPAVQAVDPITVEPSKDMVDMATEIIKKRPAEFSPAQFEDRYEKALRDLVQSKIDGGEPVIAKAPERGTVINLMDALKRSIEQDRRPPAASLPRKAAGGAAKKAVPVGKAAAAKAAPAKAPSAKPKAKPAKKASVK